MMMSSSTPNQAKLDFVHYCWCVIQAHLGSKIGDTAARSISIIGSLLPSNSVSHYPLHLDQLSYRTPHQFLSPLLLSKLYCNRFIYISISDIIDSSHLNFDSRTKEEEEERRCLAFTSPQTSALMELMLIPFSLMPPELLLRLSEDLNTYVNLLFSFFFSTLSGFFFLKFLY